MFTGSLLPGTGPHEPLLTTPEGTRELVAAHGTALGIAPELGTWPAAVVPLPAVGALTLYTDGLTEGHDGSNTERLDVEGLLALIRDPVHGCFRQGWAERCQNW